MNLNKTNDSHIISFLEDLTTEMETDEELIDALPIDVIRKELELMGANSNKFHRKLQRKLLFAKTIIAVTSLWKPNWTGELELITASDIPKQSYTFYEDIGEIKITCYWESEYKNNPSYLSLMWKANITEHCELLARFVDPETNNILTEISLGTSIVGEEYFTKKDLGFDPSNKKWAVSIIFAKIS